MYLLTAACLALFTGGERTEQVKVWDVRARSVVYELSTGNNAVSAMAWDSRRSALHVATECTRMNRMGERSGYRKARIPRWATWNAIEQEVEALKSGTGASDVLCDTEVVATSEAAEDAEAAKQDVVTEDVAGAQPTQKKSMDGIQNSPNAQATTNTTAEVLSEDDELSDAEKDEDYEEDEDDSEEDEDLDDEEMEDEDGGENQDEEEESAAEEEPDDIDEEYSAGKRWPSSCYHKENFFGYAFDAGEDMLSEFTICMSGYQDHRSRMARSVRWQYKAEPNMLFVPPTSDFDF